jgi:small-conductance mechanosensitive channel
VAYSSDLDLVRKTVLEVIATIPGVLFDPAPRVIFNNFGDTTIDFIVYYWVDLEVGDYLDSIDLAFRGINTAFSEKGIEMPYPVRTILLENKEKTTG